MTVAVQSQMQLRRTPAMVFSMKPWLVCCMGGLFFFYEFIQLNMFNAMADPLIESFSISAGQLGFLASISLYANVIFLLPAGALLDRFSTQRLILFTLSICILGTFVFATATSVWVAGFARFLTGIGSAFCFLSAIRLVSRWFSADHTALAIGVIVTIAMIGGMIAQVPLSLLLQHYQWRTTLLFDVGLGVVILFLIYFFVEDYPPDHQREDVVEHQTLEKIGFWHSFTMAYSRIQNWIAGIYTCLMNLPVMLLGAVWGIGYLERVEHLKATTASQITSMIFLGIIFGSPAMGWLSDRIKKRRLPMLIGSVISLGLSIFIVIMPTQPVFVLLMLFGFLGFISSSQVLSYPTVAESNPHYLTATAVSVVSMTTQGGGAIFQPLFGWVMGFGHPDSIIKTASQYSVSDYQRAMWILPIAFGAALIAACLLKETNCKSQ